MAQIGFLLVQRVVQAQTVMCFAYDTTLQQIASTNTWQDVTFDTNGEIDGWTHTPGSADFTCPSSGLYGATIELLVEKTGSGSPRSAVRALFNGSEIPGSHNGMDITSNNTSFSLSRTLIFNATAGQIFKVEFSASRTAVRVIPAPVSGGNWRHSFSGTYT